MSLLTLSELPPPLSFRLSAKMVAAQIAPLSFALEGDWSPASVVLVAPRPTNPGMMTAKVQTSYRANLVINMEPVEGASLDALAQKHRLQLQAQMGHYRVVREDPIEINGQPAILREHCFTDLAGFEIQQFQLLLRVDDHRLVHALASAQVGLFSLHRENFLNALQSIALRSH